MRRTGVFWGAGAMLTLWWGTATAQVPASGPSVVRPPVVVAARGPWMTLPWGAGPGQVGRLDANESNPECPSAVEIDPAGRVWVLDSVQGRVLVREGDAWRALPLRTGTAEDLAVSPDGLIGLMDRFAGQLRVFRPDGTAVSAIPLVGQGARERGGFSSVVWAPDGFWVEYDNRFSTRVAWPNGSPDHQRPSVKGRPMPSRELPIEAEMLGQDRIRVRRGARGDAPGAWNRHIRFARAVVAIDETAGLADGGAVVVVRLAQPRGPALDSRVDSVRQIVRLDARGVEVSRTFLPVSPLPHEQRRPIRVAPDGTVVAAVCTEGGLDLWRLR